MKFGKRASLLVAMTLQLGTLIWCALAKSFDSLLAARIVLGFSAAAGEVRHPWMKLLKRQPSASHTRIIFLLMPTL